VAASATADALNNAYGPRRRHVIDDRIVRSDAA
jgi:hypothetical protein